jgi:LysR family hydrogen peroxide-inducible transcriptional activator
LYFEPLAYIPEDQQFQKDSSDLNVDEILLLQDGHCFRDGILNLCKNNPKWFNHFQIESGSFDFNKLADEGLGTTLLPLFRFRLNPTKTFVEPKPAREVSLFFQRAIENASLMHYGQYG